MLHNGALMQKYGWAMPERHYGPPADLHILCFIHGLERGGSERAAVRLVRAWSAQARVTVALAEGDAGTLGHDGTRLIRPGWWMPAWFAAIWMLVWLPFVIRRERPDILFCPGNSYSLAAVVARLVLGSACPPIVMKVSNPLDRLDVPGVGQFVTGWWARLQARAIDHFVGTSPAMAEEIARITRIAPSRVTPIANPAFDRVTHATLAAVAPRLPEGDGSRHFLAVGRLVAQKDFGTLLRAFATGAGAADRLTILGEGPDRHALERLAARLGIADRVAMPGFDADVAPWLAGADALILSSCYEGLPAAVLEAMAAGRPVIATDCCVAMAPLLADRRGTLVPPGAPEALARAIAAFDPAIHDRVGARIVAARYVTDQVAATYLPLFRIVAAEATKATPPAEIPGVAVAPVQ